MVSALVARHPSAPESTLTQLVSVSFALLGPEAAAVGLPDFPADNLDKAAHLLVSLTTRAEMDLQLIV